jgi:tRNA A37 threonylcarbamoyladenosine synthetase subunit TsaC/SUA5/YrdC
LNAEYIPVDNNTITVNNGVLVASGGSGGGTTYTAGTGIDIFNDEISVIIPGKAIGGQASTIVNLTGDEIKLIRKGPIPLEELNLLIDN